MEIVLTFLENFKVIKYFQTFPDLVVYFVYTLQDQYPRHTKKCIDANKCTVEKQLCKCKKYTAIMIQGWIHTHAHTYILHACIHINSHVYTS